MEAGCQTPDITAAWPRTVSHQRLIDSRVPYPAKVVMAPRIHRNSTAPLLPPVPVRIELGVEKMPVPGPVRISERALHVRMVPRTNHLVDDQSRHGQIAQSSILRHGSQHIRHLLSPGWHRLRHGGVHEADGAIIIFTPLHPDAWSFLLPAIDGWEGRSWVDMTGGERGGPVTPGVCCHRHLPLTLDRPMHAERS